MQYRRTYLLQLAGNSFLHQSYKQHTGTNHSYVAKSYRSPLPGRHPRRRLHLRARRNWGYLSLQPKSSPAFLRQINPIPLMKEKWSTIPLLLTLPRDSGTAVVSKGRPWINSLIPLLLSLMAGRPRAFQLPKPISSDLGRRRRQPPSASLVTLQVKLGGRHIPLTASRLNSGTSILSRKSRASIHIRSGTLVVCTTSMSRWCVRRVFSLGYTFTVNRTSTLYRVHLHPCRRSESAITTEHHHFHTLSLFPYPHRRFISRLQYIHLLGAPLPLRPAQHHIHLLQSTNRRVTRSLSRRHLLPLHTHTETRDRLCPPISLFPARALLVPPPHDSRAFLTCFRSARVGAGSRVRCVRMIWKTTRKRNHLPLRPS